MDKPNNAPPTDMIIEKVRTFDTDAASFRSRIKTLKEQIKEEVENTNEFSQVQELMEQLKEVREALKRRLESNSTYMNLLSELADEKLALTDAERNISDFLLGYFVETQERQIELAPKDSREVTIKAKLGKAKDFQTNLFSRMAETEA